MMYQYLTWSRSIRRTLYSRDWE